MRVMGLDYGTKTVGVAISDPLGLTAQGIETIQRKEENKLRRTCARIEELIKEYQVEKIVLGFPKHMNNDIGERALIESGVRRENRKQYVDKIAAVFILQGYLDSIYMQKTAE